MYAREICLNQQFYLMNNAVIKKSDDLVCSYCCLDCPMNIGQCSSYFITKEKNT